MNDSPKARLKTLRDQLAAAVPRAKMKASTPPELLRRLEATAKSVAQVYLLVASTLNPDESIEEAVADALVEGHLALSELERVQSSDALSRTPTGIERRQAERHETNVVVRLLRHSVREEGDGSVAIGTETVQRAARNVSTGGIFVSLPKTELLEVTLGSVLHVLVGMMNGGPAFHARGVVMRRDTNGVGLSWVLDSDRVRKDVTALLEAVRRAAPQPGSRA